MVAPLPSSAVVFRVRAEFVAATREVRIHVLCECGNGGWIAAIASFPDLFFDERPLIGRTVGEGLRWLHQQYPHTRPHPDVAGHVQDNSLPTPKVKRKSRPKSSRSLTQQRELALAPTGERVNRRPKTEPCSSLAR